MWQLCVRIRQISFLLKKSYNEFSIGQKNAVWAAAGVISGHFYGKYSKSQKNKVNKLSENGMYVTKYIVNNINHLKDFENSWNFLAKYTQKFSSGYIYTKLFKAGQGYRMNHSPFEFIELRLWRDDHSFNDWIHNTETNNKIEKIKNFCQKTKPIKFKIMVDDSVVRLIE